MMNAPLDPCLASSAPRLAPLPATDDAATWQQRGDPGLVRQASVPARALRLSVVVPCYNVGDLAGAAIASVLAQGSDEIEVVAVDDGSTDDTLRRILAIDDPRLTVVTQANRGLAAARNTGVRHARAALIGFCDGDDLWLPGKAAAHLAAMAADPAVVLTFSLSAYLDEAGAPTGQLLVTRCQQPTARDLVARNVIGNGSTPVVRRAAFERAGLFDEALGSCEDIEMWVRIAVFTGGTLRLIPQPLTGYRVRQTSQMHTFEKYLAGSRLYLERFQSYVPGYTARDARRTFAEHLRILSRKAFDAGEIPLSRRLFAAALRRHPTLIVRDLRAFAMGGLHLLALVLPAGTRSAPYTLGRRMTRAAYAWRFGASAAGAVSRR
jgi:glycosyltransferase involved in cell wall biosynthesis